MLAIIGGTGIYELPGMQVDARIDTATPFGQPSGVIEKGRLGGQPLLFLARHGAGHKLLPHEVNYRANIYRAQACRGDADPGLFSGGQPGEEIAPGDLAMPSQYFDWTKGGRERSFFGDGVAAHVSTAQPVSARLIDWAAAKAGRDGHQAAPRRHLRLRRGPAPGHTRRKPVHAPGGLPAGGHDQRARGLPRARGANLLRHASASSPTTTAGWTTRRCMSASARSSSSTTPAWTRARALLDALLAGPPLPEEEPHIRGACSPPC